MFLGGTESQNVSKQSFALPRSDNSCKVKPVVNVFIYTMLWWPAAATTRWYMSLEWVGLMNLLSLGYDDSAALLPGVISAQGKASTSTLWSERQREPLMRKHKLTRDGTGMTFNFLIRFLRIVARGIGL